MAGQDLVLSPQGWVYGEKTNKKIVTSGIEGQSVMGMAGCLHALAFWTHNSILFFMPFFVGPSLQLNSGWHILL